MGQRSQLYIRMNNIGKCYFDSIEIDNPNSERWRDNVHGYVTEKERHEKWIKLFGNENTIIVGFHHQWLYGKSFVLVASMILNMNKVLMGKSEYEVNPFGFSNWSNVNHSLPRNVYSPIDAINYLQAFISNLFDFELIKYSQEGIQRYSLLNGEDYENGDLITRFDNGDNNDGVLIVDMLENKYCFVDVNGNEEGKFKHLNPVDAHTYLKTYYAETEEDCSEEDITEKKPKFKGHIRINKKFIKRFKGFKTLSVQELINIFPVMDEEISEANKICNRIKKQIV